MKKLLYVNKHWRINEDYNINKILYLLIDRPDDIFYYKKHISKVVWYNKNGAREFRHPDYDWPRHRDYNLPACVYLDSAEVAWHLYEKLHRENNEPAVIYYSGYKHYFINNKHMKSG